YGFIIEAILTKTHDGRRECLRAGHAIERLEARGSARLDHGIDIAESGDPARRVGKLGMLRKPAAQKRRSCLGIADMDQMSGHGRMRLCPVSNRRGIAA